jgi:hypothetical protein
MMPELDIVVWAPKAESAGKMSTLSQAIFEEAAAQDLHFAVAHLPASLFQERWKDVRWDQEDVACLRSCLMKPEHLDWIERIWEILDNVTDRVMNR